MNLHFEDKSGLQSNISEEISTNEECENETDIIELTHPRIVPEARSTREIKP